MLNFENQVRLIFWKYPIVDLKGIFILLLFLEFRICPRILILEQNETNISIFNFSGQTILDLGCGWGSVALFVAEKYPKSNVFALSNSATQKEYILDQAEAKGLSNLTVFTGDVSEFDRDDWTNKFDRIISIGKRNYNYFLKTNFLSKPDRYLLFLFSKENCIRISSCHFF